MTSFTKGMKSIKRRGKVNPQIILQHKYKINFMINIFLNYKTKCLWSLIMYY